MPHFEEPEHDVAWDCNPDMILVVESYDDGLDEEDDEGDWQVLALDRFGDRNVEPGLYSHRNEFAERQAELDEEEAYFVQLVMNAGPR